MTTRQRIKIALLRSLDRADGIPMPHDALIASAQNLVFPTQPRDDIESALKELNEADRLVCGASNFMGVSWTLTDAGNHQAKKL